MSTTPNTLRIDIVSDVVCPWCVVGYRQLEKALEIAGVPHEIHWHPFELNPSMPAEGQNLVEHVAEKYGSTKEQSQESRKNITKAGAEVGFEFNFADDTRMYNTFSVHQLLHWAGEEGREHEVKQALFAAHFTDGKNLSDNNVLAEVAAEVGLDHGEALVILEDQRFADAVRAAEKMWLDADIRGVPAVVFNRRHLVSGAQGVENFTSILKQLSEEDS